MQIAEVLALYNYNYWANGRILRMAAGATDEQFVAPGPVPHGSLRGTLVHMLDIEWSWRLRWQGMAETEALRAENFPTVAALVTRWREDEQEMRAYLATLRDDDLARGVALSRGPIPLWRFLLHVVNHGTQHRSEAAVLLTGFGHSPGDLDFTVFTRHEQGVASDR